MDQLKFEHENSDLFNMLLWRPNVIECDVAGEQSVAANSTHAWYVARKSTIKTM